MQEEMKQALLRSYDLRLKAGEVQIERGVHDIGLRTQVTSGKHLDEIIELISRDMVNMGVKEGTIHTSGNGVKVPGWFRARKRWDIVVSDGHRLMACIELKSISGSYGNNINNRVEEAIGEAVDVRYAIEHDLCGSHSLPALAYVLIVKGDSKSRSIPLSSNNSAFKQDPVFNGTSYVDRFRIMCERLLEENIFEAVWYVVVNPDEQSIEEPADALSYVSFIRNLRNNLHLDAGRHDV